MTVFREFDSTDAFAAGAVGLPGARTFYLQVRGENEAVSIKCEKEQVVALSAFLRKMLDDAPSVTDPLRESPNIIEPDEAAFALGSVGLAYDRGDDRVILQFEELSPDDDSDFDASKVRIRITRAQAVAFCDTADRLVRAGRPPCIYCGLPVNRDGHACPRMN